MNGEYSNFDLNLKTAAYELKNPLALVRQLSLLIQDENISEDKKIELAKKIQLTTERNLRLTTLLEDDINQLELFSLEPVNPMAICGKVVDKFSEVYSMQEKNIRIKRQKHTDLISGNNYALERILTIFVDNALDYVKPKSVVEFNISKIRSEFIRIGLKDCGPRLTSKFNNNYENKDTSRPGFSNLNMKMADILAQKMNSELGFIKHKNGMTFYIDIPISKQMSLL